MRSQVLQPGVIMNPKVSAKPYNPIDSHFSSHWTLLVFECIVRSELLGTTPVPASWRISEPVHARQQVKKFGLWPDNVARSGAVPSLPRFVSKMRWRNLATTLCARCVRWRRVLPNSRTP